MFARAKNMVRDLPLGKIALGAGAVAGIVAIAVFCSWYFSTGDVHDTKGFTSNDTKSMVDKVKADIKATKIDDAIAEEVYGVYQGLNIDLASDEWKAFASKCRNQIGISPCKQKSSYALYNSYDMLKRAQHLNTIFILGVGIVTVLGVLYIYPDQSNIVKTVYTVFIASLLYTAFKTLYKSYVVSQSIDVFTNIWQDYDATPIADDKELEAKKKSLKALHDAIKQAGPDATMVTVTEIDHQGAPKPTPIPIKTATESMYELTREIGKYTFGKNIETYYNNLLSLFF